MQHTSGIILPVSKLLQKKELDIFAVIEIIDSALDILRQNRSNNCFANEDPPTKRA